MGIWANIEVETGEILGLASKAVFSFCFEALWSYCRRGDLSKKERENCVGELRWFETLQSKMKEPLCLLYQATFQPWEYSENEYIRYLADFPNSPVSLFGVAPLSEERFLEACRDAQNCWVGIPEMINVVDDLIRVLEEDRLVKIGGITMNTL